MFILDLDELSAARPNRSTSGQGEATAKQGSPQENTLRTVTRTLAGHTKTETPSEMMALEGGAGDQAPAPAPGRGPPSLNLSVQLRLPQLRYGYFAPDREGGIGKLTFTEPFGAAACWIAFHRIRFQCAAFRVTAAPPRRGFLLPVSRHGKRACACAAPLSVRWRRDQTSQKPPSPMSSPISPNSGSSRTPLRSRS